MSNFVEDYHPSKYFRPGEDFDMGQFGVDSLHLGGVFCSNLALLHR